jgi:hypothetical protein
MPLAMHMARGVVMRAAIRWGLLVLLGAAGAGCASHHDMHMTRMRAPGYLVPTTAIVQHEGTRGRETAEQVLPSSDGDVWIVRGERTVEGNLPIGGISAMSIYTYDVQTLSHRHGDYGYRYRVGTQTAVSIP